MRRSSVFPDLNQPARNQADRVADNLRSIQAIVFAHSVNATAFSVTDSTFEVLELTEAVINARALDVVAVMPDAVIDELRRIFLQ